MRRMGDVMRVCREQRRKFAGDSGVQLNIDHYDRRGNWFGTETILELLLPARRMCSSSALNSR